MLACYFLLSMFQNKLGLKMFIRYFVILGIFFISNLAIADEIKPRTAIAMHGEVKYKSNFKHLEYVNPDAPKGGSLKLHVIGSFDSLNPYILKGNPATGMGLVYETLLVSTDDEAFSEYANIAEKFEMPEDRSWVRFYINKAAKWHDGKPITAEDVKWSFDTLISKGNPFYRAYYANVKEAVIEDAHTVKFNFNVSGNRELPLIMGQMPVFPKHFWQNREFNKTSLDAPLGSGPYKVEEVIAGRSITFKRVKDWWGKDLPINKGRYNFDEITFTYYRDAPVAKQAFFAGEYDFIHENIAKDWATSYDVPAVREGKIIKREQAHQRPAGMQGFAYNIRKDIFKDKEVRKALAYAFDFEWSNKQFAYGAYKRTKSYFENSELASHGVPTGRELEILEKFKDQLPPELFTKEYAPPKTSGNGKDIRKNLRIAKQILKKAGWTLNKDTGNLEKDGVPLKFEILLVSPAFERWVAPFISNLKKIGVEAKIRIVDSSQYQKRVEDFDFDIIVQTFGQSLSPGNEQRDFWHSSKADVKGSRNVIGIKNPVIDELIDMVIHAPNRNELIYRTRALDRVLLWNYYVIPQWYNSVFRIAYWDKFGLPQIAPKYNIGYIDTWWSKSP